MRSVLTKAAQLPLDVRTMHRINKWCFTHIFIVQPSAQMQNLDMALQ